MKKKRKFNGVLSWLLILCLFCSILTGCGGEQQELDNQEESSSAEESSSGWGEGPADPVDPVITPEPTADPDEGGTIPDVVANFEYAALEIKYADIPWDYSRMSDNTMIEARKEFTEIEDAVGIPLWADQTWFDEGTFFEKNDIPLANLDYSSLLTNADPEKLKAYKKERFEWLATLTATERIDFYRSQMVATIFQVPQSLLGFAALCASEEVCFENNAVLITAFSGYIAECNAIKFEDFSPEFQEMFEDEAEFQEFLGEITRQPTEEEIKAEKMDYNVPEGTIKPFLIELSKMPLGIDRCLEYNPDYPNDIRYLRMTEEYRWYATYFAVILEYMGDYGLATFETKKNWVLPTMRADDRYLAVIEADYQENTPNERGVIKDPHKGFWMNFEVKDGQLSNRLFAGMNYDDRRWMTAEPQAKPISRDYDTTSTPSPNPTATPNQGTKPAVYEVIRNCVDEQGVLLRSDNLGSYSEKTILTITQIGMPQIEGHTYKSGLPETGYEVKAGNNIITLVYGKNQDPPGPDPDPDPDPTPTPEPTTPPKPDPEPTPEPEPTPTPEPDPTPTPKPDPTPTPKPDPTPNPTPDPTNPPSDPTPTPAPPDGQGGKDPMTGTSPNGSADTGGGNTAAGDVNKDLVYNEELQKEQEAIKGNPQAEANRQEQQQQQQAAQEKSNEEEKAAQAAAEQEAINKGQPAGTTGHDNNPAAEAGGTTSGNTGSSTSGETTGTINASGTIGTEESKDSNGNTTAVSGTIDSGPSGGESGDEPSGSDGPSGSESGSNEPSGESSGESGGGESGGNESGGGSGNVSGKLDPPPPEDD